jgi:hypothetical protein
MQGTGSNLQQRNSAVDATIKQLLNRLSSFIAPNGHSPRENPDSAASSSEEHCSGVEPSGPVVCNMVIRLVLCCVVS